jgi:S-DNA-T family DNA segregation ATPase FtsK/SpoIIIE
LPAPVAHASAPRGKAAARGAESRSGQAVPHIVDHEEERRSQTSASQEAFRFGEGGSGPKGPFELPDVTRFQLPPAASTTYDRDSLLMNSKILEKKLQDFGVRGKVVRVHPGPVITMYEYEPAPGMKVSKIVNLSDDLAMALRALSIRIIAPLPGKSVVGIEVPNVERETVYLRTLLEAESFRNNKTPLAIAMGKDIFGNCVEADLTKMPHLLVAGATGTGKSVFLNSILCSILCRVTPQECKFLLIDPKLLELSIYEGIPHLIADVVTQPKRAAAALAGIVRKMEERYMMMSALQVRNIDQFNERVDKALAEGETHFRLKSAPGEEEGMELPYSRLPYIVVVIDELADLMVQVARDVEEALQRLAQMARAAGIHLILATQRPSVDVLTGVIKANFPARVSFQVSSRTDSRTVLDQNGADNLLGQGDMLYLPPGTSRLQRLHGPFVTEKEVAEVASFLREQGAPEFDETLMRASEESASSSDESEDVDEYFDKAVAIVAETRNASISYIQRRLKVGYNRAARIVEHMERENMIGPQEGTKSREVFLPAPCEDE